MTKALIRTAVLVLLVLLASRFIPAVAAHEWLLLAIAVAVGLIGLALRLLFFTVVGIVVAAFLFHFL